MAEEKYNLDKMLDEIKRDEMVHTMKRNGLVTQDVISAVVSRVARGRKSPMGKEDGKKS